MFFWTWRRYRAIVGWLTCLLLLTGCGSANRKPVFPVQGKVLDATGQPAAGARVLFHPKADADPNVQRPVGVADTSGLFTLTTYAQGDGAPAGEYAVTIEWKLPRRSPLDPVPPDQLGGRYANPKGTPFTATIGKSPTALEPFILK